MSDVVGDLMTSAKIKHQWRWGLTANSTQDEREAFVAAVEWIHGEMERGASLDSDEEVTLEYWRPVK